MAIYKKSDISPIFKKNSNPGNVPGSRAGPDDQSQSDESDDDVDSDDKLDQSIEEKLSQRKDETVEDMKKSGKGMPGAGKPGHDPNARPKLEPISTSLDNVINWKELIRQFVTKAGPPEITFAKPHRRTATQVSIAQQIGAAALRPGERNGDGVFKLVIVFDSSGSMGSTIRSALAETTAMLLKIKGSLNPIVGLTFFADKPLYLAADLFNNTAWPIDSLRDLKKPAVGEKMPLSQVLRSAMTGGTTFDSSMSEHLASMAAQGYNIIIFSDTDILLDSNWPNFTSLLSKAKNQLFFIANSKKALELVIKKLGPYPKTFSYMS